MDQIQKQEEELIDLNYGTPLPDDDIQNMTNEDMNDLLSDDVIKEATIQQLQKTFGVTNVFENPSQMEIIQNLNSHNLYHFVLFI